MQLIPVLDLLGGTVVRGVAGDRASYRPVQSRIVASSDPMEVARAIRSQFGLTTLYVADLDAIVEQRANIGVWSALADDGFRLLLDCGLRCMEDASAAFAHGAASVVAGLETLPGPDLLHALCGRFGADRIVFSLDLHGARTLANGRWKDLGAEAIAAEAVSAGVRTMIVLDLACVGTGAGLGTIALCQRLRERHPGVELITGGGVRNAADLRALSQAGLDGALVASALHSGAITREELPAALDGNQASGRLPESGDGGIL